MADTIDVFIKFLERNPEEIIPKQHEFFRNKLLNDEKFRKQAEYYVKQPNIKINRQNSLIYKEILEKVSNKTIKITYNPLFALKKDEFNEEILPEKRNKVEKGMSLYSLYLQSNKGLIRSNINTDRNLKVLTMFEKQLTSILSDNSSSSDFEEKSSSSNSKVVVVENICIDNKEIDTPLIAFHRDSEAATHKNFSLIKNEYKEELDSFSFQNDCFHKYSDDNNTEEIEETKYKHERTLMKFEDFRSYELRNKDFSQSSQYRVACKLNEIYKLRSDINKIIEIVEKNITNQVTLQIGRMNLLIDISYQTIFTSKAEIFSNFCIPIIENSSYIQRLENNIEELKYKTLQNDDFCEIEKNMNQAYKECFIIKDNKDKNPLNVHILQKKLGEYQSKRQLNIARQDFLKEFE